MRPALVLVVVLAACGGGVKSAARDSRPCTDIFRPGAITKAEWGTTFVGCNGSSVATLRFGCDKGVLLSNDYGWGWVGQPWQTGTPPRGCP